MSDKAVHPNFEGGNKNRALALDALRGFAILTMFLSGLIPFGVLPSWMYHAQVPPPNHIFNPDLPGITWVDLVFPFFLFSMGAAIPLALTRRIKQNTPKLKIVVGILIRGLLLVGFAIYDQHIRPNVINPNPNISTYLLALLGFALLFPALMRFPKEWDTKTKYSIKAAGFIGIILFLIFMHYPEGKYGTGFSLYRSDIIILVLANVSVTGALIWLFSRKNLLFRLSWLGILIAIRLSHAEVGWVSWLWNHSPAPWLGILYFQQYLFIIIPGTIAGDLILKWLNQSSKENYATMRKSKLLLILILMFTFIFALLVGLKGRFVIETTILSTIMCTAGWYLLKNPLNETERFLKNIFQLGVYWLLLGLVFEPYEGGIKKDHPTLSYYFITTGLAIFLLIAFTIIIDIFRKKNWTRLLIDTGQNPMIAYAGITNLLPPLLAITTLGALLQNLFPTPWLGALSGLIKTSYSCCNN